MSAKEYCQLLVCTRVSRLAWLGCGLGPKLQGLQAPLSERLKIGIDVQAPLLTAPSERLLSISVPLGSTGVNSACPTKVCSSSWVRGKILILEVTTCIND